MRWRAAMAVVLVCLVPPFAQRIRAETISAEGVAAFADRFIPREMARRHIPGVVFVFVSGGRTALARGFGAAQLEPYRPVDPERTLFRLASVSKTVTASAALRLVEQGRLDLHKDVNAYLKSFRLPGRHGTVTLHHLLTHTAGFDDRLTGIAARSASEIQPLAAYLARTMPPTFVEPGRVISYSNHGYALVGLLVEEASGRPFPDFVRREIFEPLAMRHSGFLTGPVPPDLAVAHAFADGRHRPLTPEYLNVGAAGAVFATGSDMGRFLVAQLRGTVARQHTRQFAQLAQFPGWAYGLWEDLRDGQRALLHNGGGKGYRALLYLLPDHDAGFFLAYNLADRHEEGELLEVFITEFRRAFVRGTVSAAPRDDEGDDASVLGEYVYVRRARTTLEKIVAVVNRVRIERAEQGSLTMSALGKPAVALAPIGSRTYRRTDNRGTVAFDADGRLAVSIDSGFPAVFEPVPGWETLRVQVGWLFVLAVVFLYAVVRRPTRLAALAAALNIVFLIGFPLAFFGRMEGGVPEFVYGVPAIAKVLLLVPLATGAMGVAAAIAAVQRWRDRQRSLLARVECTIVAVALVAFIAFTRHWHLLGPF